MMRRAIGVVVGSLVSLCVVLWGGGKEEGLIGMKLVTPMAASVHHEEYATVTVALTSAEVEGIIVTAEANQSVTLMREKGRGTYCKTIRLIPGENSLTVTAIRNQRGAEQLSVRIYHDIVYEKRYKNPPEAYTVKTFHLSRNEKACLPCHAMKINETPGIAFENAEDSNCFPCHQKLTTRGQGHAPAINFLCTSCHKTAEMIGDEANTTSQTPKFRFVKKVGEECLTCHKKERELWDEKRFHHMPVDAAQCVRCHNPHSSQNRYFLKAKSWTICTSCHIDKIDGNHILNTIVSKTHPTRGKPDPSRPGRELECISCHNPHASDTWSLIEGKSPMSICQKCHKK